MIKVIVASAISGVIGGLTSAVMSVLVAAYAVPMPIDQTHHVVGYGIGGFFCGLVSGSLSVVMYARREARLAAAAAAVTPRA